MPHLRRLNLLALICLAPAAAAPPPPPPPAPEPEAPPPAIEKEDQNADGPAFQAPPGAMEIINRVKNAQTLIKQGDLDAAGEEYLWLWNNMLDVSPASAAIRQSRMLREMSELADHHAPFRTALADHRDALQAALEAGDTDFSLLIDWVSLNQALHEEDRTLAWYDRVKTSPAAGESLKRVASKLRAAMLKHGRWADLGRLYTNPVDEATRSLRAAEFIPPHVRQHQEAAERQLQSQRKDAGQHVAILYGACLAAQRDEIADAVSKALLQFQNTADSRLQLVFAAIEAGEPRSEHELWILEAQDMAEGDERLLDGVRLLGERLANALGAEPAGAAPEPQIPTGPGDEAPKP